MELKPWHVYKTVKGYTAMVVAVNDYEDEYNLLVCKGIIITPDRIDGFFRAAWTLEGNANPSIETEIDIDPGVPGTEIIMETFRPEPNGVIAVPGHMVTYVGKDGETYHMTGVTVPKPLRKTDKLVNDEKVILSVELAS